MSKKLIGIYENPAEDVIETIAKNVNMAKQHQELLVEGFTCIGTFGPHSTEQDKEAFIQRAVDYLYGRIDL